MEYIVCGSRAITPRILPVEMMVVYKGPVENDAPVGLERACDYVGGVRRCSAISGRTRPTFRVRLDNKSPEVRNPTIDGVYFLRPPPPRRGSSGSNVSSPPTTLGALKS